MTNLLRAEQACEARLRREAPSDVQGRFKDSTLPHSILIFGKNCADEKSLRMGPKI